MLVPVEQPGKCLIENILERDNKLAKRENINSYIAIVVVALLTIVCFEMCEGAGANSVWRLCSAMAPLTIKLNSAWCELGQRAVKMGITTKYGKKSLVIRTV